MYYKKENCICEIPTERRKLRVYVLIQWLGAADIRVEGAGGCYDKQKRERPVTGPFQLRGLEAFTLRDKEENRLVTVLYSQSQPERRQRQRGDGQIYLAALKCKRKLLIV